MNATTTELTPNEQREMSQWFDMGELAKTNNPQTVATWIHDQAAEQAERRAKAARKAREYWDWVVS
jgi:hypothetical protein